MKPVPGLRTVGLLCDSNSSKLNNLQKLFTYFIKKLHVFLGDFLQTDKSYNVYVNETGYTERRKKSHEYVGCKDIHTHTNIQMHINH